jgi:hypothetical protein
MTAKQLASGLFGSRKEASGLAYVPTLLVIILFILMGHDEPITGMIAYYVLLLVCLLQFRFRTLAGWLLLLGASCWYAADVAIHPRLASGFGEYGLFIAFGAVPAITLLIFRPRLDAKTPPAR